MPYRKPHINRRRKDNALCHVGAACPCDSCHYENNATFCDECEEYIDPNLYPLGLCGDCDEALYEESIQSLKDRE